MRRSHGYILMLLFSCCCFLHVQSQDFIYKHYDVQDGLASPTIHSIYQDKSGFLWLGTESGLCRYDGTNFRTFTVKDGLPGNEVFGIFEDKRGRLWLQLYKTSIAYILNGKIYSPQNDSLLEKLKFTTRVYGITEDKDGNICICDNDRIYIVSMESKKIKEINSLNGELLEVSNLTVDHNKNLLLCTTEALYRYDGNRFELLKFISKKGEKMSPNEVFYRANYFVTGSGEKLSVHLKDTVVHARFPSQALKYTAISDSVFAINTSEGAYIYDTRNYSMIKILPGFKTTNTFRDREGNLWIGTVSKGLYKVSSEVIINKKINAQDDDIYFITRENEKLIVGNNNMRLYAFYQDSFIDRSLRGKYGRAISQKIFYYEKLGDDRYFIAHGMGIGVCKGRTLIKDVVTSMLKQVSVVDDKHILIAINAGIFLVRKHDLAFIDTIWQHKTIASLKVGNDVLVGTLHGLYVLKPEGNSYVIKDSLLPFAFVDDIKQMPGSYTWVSTYENGVYCLKDGKVFMHFGDSSGLLSNNGRCLFIQGNEVWVGTDKGLARITVQGENFQILRYSTSDGLPSNIINTIYVEGNTVYAGTSEGLCYFDKTKIETTSICNLVLTGVRTGDGPVELADKYNLRRKEGLIVEFSGISLRSEKEMRYRYRIQGIHDKWQTTTQNSLEFASLPYGNYVLEIVAINKFGKESNPLELQLGVPKPFYRNIWFIILMISVPLLLIFFYINRRMSIARKKQMLKLQQEIKMLELEQMALRSQMNPHFIFNCISIIQQLVSEHDTDNSYKFITSFSQLMRQTLDHASELFIPLDDEIKFLTNYFELERIRLEDRFSYSINTSGLKNGNHLYVPNMVIQPFAENAIKHGIRYKKNGEGFIEVSFTQDESLLRCIITDNGIGRKKAEQIRKELGVRHNSKGMDLTFKRIESLNSLTGGRISITIEDMCDEKENPLGTKVIIEFYKMSNRYDKNSNN